MVKGRARVYSEEKEEKDEYMAKGRAKGKAWV